MQTMTHASRGAENSPAPCPKIEDVIAHHSQGEESAKEPLLPLNAEGYPDPEGFEKQNQANPTGEDVGAPKREKGFPPLETVTRPNITTPELAYYTNSKPQTWRAHACYGTGPIRPLRIGGRLNWPTDKVRELVGVAK